MSAPGNAVRNLRAVTDRQALEINALRARLSEAVALLRDANELHAATVNGHKVKAALRAFLARLDAEGGA